jgi:hypothetical protein
MEGWMNEIAMIKSVRWLGIALIHTEVRLNEVFEAILFGVF